MSCAEAIRIIFTTLNSNTMAEEQKVNQEGENKGAAESAGRIKEEVRDFFTDLLNIKTDTDKEGTIATIKDNISMRGHNAWILVFSILIASIGLNANSPAVVIGAMLISPLMGPILGIGLGVGINDIQMLKRSAMNLGVMVGLSLITSFIYFSIPLFQDGTPEILARVRPDIRDVLIALCGGLALIVAISRPSAQTNTVAGVAIATALMPPLCTAGYGLGTGNFNYFFGAMFLFTINCIFIALATFVIVKYLRFRMVQYINADRRRKISRIASFIAVLIISGSVFSFYNLIVEKRWNLRASHFVQELRDDGFSIIGENDEIIDFRKRSIRIPLIGQSVGDPKIRLWERRLTELGIDTVNLQIVQEDDSEINRKVANLEELYKNSNKIILDKDAALQSKDNRIRLLEKELEAIYDNKVDMVDISKQVKDLFPQLSEISYFEEVVSDFDQLDTISIFKVRWSEDAEEAYRRSSEVNMKNWLRRVTRRDSLSVRSY